ncbi:hypothetical protein [Buttiauxella sp. B2]|nr:hypothetical protein [Buttiauxella sp. B2]
MRRFIRPNANEFCAIEPERIYGDNPRQQAVCEFIQSLPRRV